MNDREISELKLLDMLFKIFGISIVDHEEVIFCDCPISGRCIIPSIQKDIQIGILEEKEPWYIRGRYDMYDVLREAVRILEHVDNSETLTISSERWPILTQRRPFVRTLERRANEFLKECRYLPDFNNFKIVGFSKVNECSHVIRIYMGNGTIVERSMSGKDLGRGYYSRLVFVLLNMFEEVLEIQEVIDKERQSKQMKNDTELLIVRYCEADAKTTMEAALAMKEDCNQIILNKLEEVNPWVPLGVFESLVTGSPNGEAEILIDVNKKDKKMMIPVVRRPEIKEVIFNEPATIIVFWKDETKTVVKCGKGEKFDPEKGVAIALAKKILYSKDYSRVIASSDDWKKAKEAKKKAAAKKKTMPKLPVNANITKTSTIKKTTRKGAK